MRPAPKYLVLAAVGLLVLYLAVSKLVDALRSDEARIRMVLREVAEYARDRDAGAVLEYLDPKYRDPQGFSAPEVRRIVVGYLLSAESVEAELEPVGIEGLEVEGDEVDVLVRALVAVHMSGEHVVTLADATLRGEYLVIRLRRHESYFRAKSVRPAGPEEIPEQ